LKDYEVKIASARKHMIANNGEDLSYWFGRLL